MRARWIPPLLLALAVPGACFYTHGNHQSAHTLRKGHWEFVPYYQNETFYFDGLEDVYPPNQEMDGFQHGMQLGYGISDVLSVRVRYEQVDPEGIQVYNYIGIGPKFGKPGGWFALELPVGMYYGLMYVDDNAPRIHPTGIITLPLGSLVDVTVFGKVLYSIDPTTRSMYSVGAGADAWLPGKWVCLRPELSFLKEFGGYESWSALGLAVAFTIPWDRTPAGN